MASGSNSSNSTNNLSFQARLLLEVLLHPLNWCSFCTSRLPMRLMYHSAAGWIDFPAEAARAVKKSFARRDLAVQIEIDGALHVACLLGMLLIDQAGHARSITWIDAEGGTFFPKQILRGSAPADDEGIGRTTPAPPGPRPCFESIEDMVRLDEVDNDYKKVKKTFLRGMGRLRHVTEVTSVNRCSHASINGMARLEEFERAKEMTATSRSYSKIRYGGMEQSLEGWRVSSRRDLHMLMRTSDGEPSAGASIFHQGASKSIVHHQYSFRVHNWKEYWRRLQSGGALLIRRHFCLTRLASPQRARATRLPRYLDRYRRNKNDFL